MRLADQGEQFGAATINASLLKSLTVSSINLP